MSRAAPPGNEAASTGHNSDRGQSASTDSATPKYRPHRDKITICFYTGEIERALVSTLWHYPKYVDAVHLTLDPELHFLDPAHRIVLEMISVVFWDLGDCDWTSVLHAIREVDCLEECGGLQGLNDIFTDDGRYPEGRGSPEIFIREYMRLLFDYAIQRETDCSKPIYRFTGGKGTIRPNRLAHREGDPSDVGEALIRGHRYRIRGWHNGEGLSITFYSEGR